MGCFMSETVSNWEKFKKKVEAQGDARPWHLLNPAKHVDQATIDARMATCRDCDRFISGTTQCRECGCIMSMKTRLSTAACPLGKW